MPSLQWMFNRFKNMPLQEIPHRISERIKIEQDKLGHNECKPLPDEFLQKQIPSLPWTLDITQLSDVWIDQLHSDAQRNIHFLIPIHTILSDDLTSHPILYSQTDGSLHYT